MTMTWFMRVYTGFPTNLERVYRAPISVWEVVVQVSGALTKWA